MEKWSPTHQKLEKGFWDFEDIIGIGKNISSNGTTIVNPEEYKKIIELSVAGILIADKQGKIISWNNALEKLTGIKQSEVTGLPVWDVQYRLTPQELKTPGFLSHLEKRLTGIINESDYWQRQVFEQKMTDINGSEMTVEMSAFVTASPNGNLLVAGYRDISMQKTCGDCFSITK